MIPILIIFASALLLLLLLLLNFLNRIEPQHVDLNFLRQKNLYLLHVLRILESPDYKYLSQNNKKYRDHLFLSYAGTLKQDMDELAALGLGFQASFYYCLFRFFYGVMILKNKFYSSVDDLRVLVGIELLMVKKAGT
ncbi:MAG: hypothetical protein HY645_00340 [Acidobacteria bacterium]|nr:hypothetical protein [Acidobacteriota bacterium]